VGSEKFQFKLNNTSHSVFNKSTFLSKKFSRFFKPLKTGSNNEGQNAPFRTEIAAVDLEIYRVKVNQSSNTIPHFPTQMIKITLLPKNKKK